MSVLAAIVQEVDEVEMAGQKVAHIRVSPRAIKGSVVATPLSDQGARGRAMMAMLGVDLALDARETWREILVHPDDWRDVTLRTAAPDDVGIDRLVGIPVQHEHIL